MKVGKDMNLSALASLIADGMATEGDAAIVRDALIAHGFDGVDLLYVPEETWIECAYQTPTA